MVSTEPEADLSGVEWEPGPEGMKVLPQGNISYQICEFSLWTNCFLREQWVPPVLFLHFTSWLWHVTPQGLPLILGLFC